MIPFPQTPCPAGSVDLRKLFTLAKTLPHVSRERHGCPAETADPNRPL